ncbi:MAG: hypothetical protein AAFV25_13085, partial [Bacteroidota bacterium]
LVYLMISLPNPLDQEYTEMVQLLMEKEQFLTEEEAMSEYPALKDLKTRMQDMAKMRDNIRKVSQHPIPPDQSQSGHLMTQVQELKAVKREMQVMRRAMTDGTGKFAIVE